MSFLWILLRLRLKLQDPVIKQASSKELLIFKRIQPNSNSINIANKLVNNQLYVNKIWPTYTFKGSLTWKEDPFKDETWRFYYHSLDMVGYLMNAYEKNHNQAYLKKAKWYIQSWMSANPSPSHQASTAAWDDHSTANRVTNMIYFWHYYKDSSIYDAKFNSSLMKMLQKHGDYLADDQHYTANNNHGIFQDRSLIELSLFFPKMKNSPYWYNKAMKRLMVHVQHDVTSSGVHKEHSPSYQLVTLNLFKGIDQFITQHGKKNNQLRTTIEKMENYVAYLVKPDGTLPILGDSSVDSIYPLKNIISSKLKYAVTKGAQGVKPAGNAIYPDGGVAIFHNMWGKNTPFYFLFTTAYHSNVHKHADDLSFLLTYGKTDYFVDSGKYSYNEHEKYRKYFRSTLAHNTITVDGKSYPLTEGQVKKSKMSRYKNTSNYSYVTGSHTLYKGVTIKRTVVYFNNRNSILVRDVVQSPQKHTYSEVFNIGKDVQVKSTNNKTFILKSKLENKQIEFKQLTKASKFKRYTGSTNPIGGWQSLEFNKKLPITQLQFTNQMKNMEYKYVINADSKLGVQNFTVKSQGNSDLYTIEYKNGKHEKISIK